MGYLGCQDSASASLMILYISFLSLSAMLASMYSLILINYASTSNLNHLANPPTASLPVPMVALRMSTLL